jgi:hypothetical protein
LLITGLAQGPFMVDATPRGGPDGYRTDPVSDWNLQISRTFFRSLRVGAEIFNVLNSGASLRVDDLTGPQFLQKLPEGVQPPRFARLSVSWEF